MLLSDKTTTSTGTADHPAEKMLILSGGQSVPEKQTDKEENILSGKPISVFTLPTGKDLPIYPKAQGYFYLIEDAAKRYLEALFTYNLSMDYVRPEYKRRWYQTKRRAMAVYKKKIARWEDDRLVEIDGIGEAKYRLLRLIFEDKYNPGRSVELTEDEYLAMPNDVVLNIIDAYKEANDVADILKRLMPGWDKKKELEKEKMDMPISMRQ